VVSNPDLVGVTMTDSVLTFEALDVGVVEVILTASDTALHAADTFNITVVEEVLLLLRYEGRRIQNRDTIDVCNPAGAVFVEVISSVEWGFEKVSEATWLVMGIEQDSSLNLAFSQNLLEEPRVAEILVHDEQGHEFTFYLKQSDCTIDVEAFGARTGMRMYPNPVEHVLYIAPAEGLLNGDASLEILDGNGRLLYQEEVEAGAYGPIAVDMSGYTEGMYFVRIRSGEGIWMDKVIKL
jgi:hypothetical protein